MLVTDVIAVTGLLGPRTGGTGRMPSANFAGHSFCLIYCSVCVVFY